MLYVIRGGAVLLALVIAAPQMAEAQWFRNKTVIRQKTVITNGTCSKCRREATQCSCAPPPAAICPAPPQPVYETQYRQEQAVINRAFVETHYRNETYTEMIPVTHCESIVVDEGCYQQIWVPKLVTKQIPKTCLEPRVSCRTVPFQTTKCVPEIITRSIPYQTVRCAPAPTMCGPGMPSAMSPLPAISSYPLPPTSFAPPATSTAGQGPMVPLPPADSADPGAAAGLADPRFASNGQFGETQQVPKAPTSVSLGDYRTNSALNAGEFSPAAPRPASVPSAAAVWRTPRATNLP